MYENTSLEYQMEVLASYLKQGPAKQSRHIMNTATLDGFTILSFLPRLSGQTKATDPSFLPNSIRRERDGEVFTIGDAFTYPGLDRGDKPDPSGTITGFSLLEGTIFIEHTWSGVGFALDAICKQIKLPSAFQPSDQICFSFLQRSTYSDEGDKKLYEYATRGRVTAVHFFPGKVKYDLEIPIDNESPTRIHNIDSCFVLPYRLAQ
jgi:hypothetical protein